MIVSLANRYFRLQKTIERLARWVQVFDTRMELRRIRRKLIRKKGGSVVNRKIKKEIKAYAKNRFGSRSYWPGVALAAELRGEYIHGWIPFDYFYFELEPKLNPKEYANIGDIRCLDHRRFGDFAIQPLFLRILNNFYNADFEVIETDEVLNLLDKYYDTIVVKQEFSWGGKQVRVMHSTEFKPEQLHGGSNYVIQPFIKQHRILDELYPHSVNTFRVKTFRRKDGSIKVLFVYLRFGVDGARVDNTTSGGQCILFDPTGKPEEISVDGDSLKADRKHKNTGFVFADLKIPMFNDIVNSCISNHLRFPFVRLIGWDICVDESGSPRLIEWNTQRASFDGEDAIWGPFFPDDQEF